MGGCLPLLIQFPILIALYNIVMDPLKYICQFSDATISQITTVVKAYEPDYTFASGRTIDLLGKMKDLGYEHFKNVEGVTEEAFAKLPNLDLFGIIDLADTPNLKTAFNFSGEGFFLTDSAILLLIPVLTFAAYFFSMKISRKLTYQPMSDDQAMGCSNKLMDLMMPAMSVFITFGVPAAIGVYWIFKSLIGVLKQFILKTAMPIPKFSEEDYKAAEKEIGAKPEKASAKNKSGKVVRSLHHIDDEDFADTAEAGRARREALEAQATADEEARINKSKGNALRGDAPVMKDDDRPAKKSKKKEKDEEKSEDNTNTDGEK